MVTNLTEPPAWATRTPVVSDRNTVDLGSAEAAAAQFLEALGVDLSRCGLAETPLRMAKAYRDLFTARSFDLTVFPNYEHYEQLIIQQRIPFHSVCEHHGLPFIGTADIGYLPSDRIVGLSKLARVVELYSRTAQVQERLTTQIAAFLTEHLNPVGVGVVMRAEHLCMTLRGVQVAGTQTITSALTGVLLDNPSAREEFLALTRNNA